MHTTLEAQLSGAVIGMNEAEEIPSPPVFTDKFIERNFVKQRLAAAFRLFAYYQFDEGLAGHMTVRDPVEPDTFWVNPVGRHFSQIKASHLVRLNHEGNLVEGHALVNIAAFMIHATIHANYPHINAVAHAHSPAGRAWSTQGRPLQPITQDSCVFFEQHDILNVFEGVVLNASEGATIAAKLGTKNIALILQNHGLLTVGKDVDSAISLFMQLESACATQLRLEGARTTQLIPDDIARKTREFVGSDLVVWGGFQPLYQLIDALQPDFKE